MSIIIGPDGSLVNTSNVGSQFIPNITPNIGALANVASLGGSSIPKGVENEDGTFTIPNIEMRVRGTGLEPGQLQNMYGISGDQGVAMFEFLSPVQTGTTTFDPEDDDLMSDKNLDKINEGFDGAAPPTDGAQKQDLARMAQKGAGIFGQGIGETLGASYVGMNLPYPNIPKIKGNIGRPMYGPSDVLDAGVNALMPFGEKSKVEEAGLSYMKGGGRQEDGSYSFSDKLYGNQLKANLQTAGFVAGGNFVGQVIAGADPMDAAKDAAKTGVAYFIGNAIAGPTGGKVAAWISNFL